MAIFEIKKNGKLFNPKKYDFSAALNAGDLKDVYQLSGMRDIVAAIENQLKRKGILSSLFVEFNLLGTILDPSSKDELNSFTYIKNNTSGFSDGVMGYSSRIIQWLFDVYGSTLFYNPNIFLDPQSPQVLYSILDKLNIDENLNAQIALIRAFENTKIDKEDEEKAKAFVDHLRYKGAIHTETEYRYELFRARGRYILLPDGRTLFDHITSDSQKELFKLALLEKYPNDSSKQYKPLDKAKTKFAGSSKFSRKYEDILQTASEFRQREDKTEEDFSNFHSFYHWCIPNNGKTIYLAIPVLGTPSSNRITKRELNNIQGQGVVFVFFDLCESYTGDIVNDIEEISTVLYDKIGDIVRTLTYNYLFNVGINLSEEVKKESIKSAISAIMSRNMSHNLGSHYLYYTKAHLEKLANNSKNSGPDIRGAAKVLGYMQARMDYLATIISNDKYPNGAVNFKSQIYDELTIDDFSKRHFSSNTDKTKRTTNFLLSNIIMSENFSRSNIYSNDVIPEDNHMPLILQVKMWNGNSYDTFTGSSKQRIVKKEEDVKNKLSKLNIALPGGTMSCHAFFNVLENFIRNSAKYLQEDFNNDEGLVITIAIKPDEKDNHKYNFIIYDNKANANIRREFPDGSQKTLIENIKGQLESLRILDDFNGIEKSSKGLKEMLFSSVWMRTYNYPEESYADIISKIHNEKDKQKKLDLISHYAFSIVAVDSTGAITDAKDNKANLGLVFTLPEFQYLAELAINSKDSETSIIKKSLQTYADIVEFSRNHPGTSEIKKYPYLRYFTRVCFSKSFDELGYRNFVAASNICEDNNLSRIAYKYKTILDKKFWNETGGDIDKLQISIGGDIFDGENLQDDVHTVYFQRHLNSQEDLTDFIGYAYADSISGGNYTITLSSLMQQGLDDFGHYKTWADRIYGLKVKESALTRITIVDERLYTSMHSAGSARELELSLKNIRVLNYEPDNGLKGEFNFNDVLKGNSFRDAKPGTHFLSIHLGLIEKMIKSEQIVKCISGENVDFDKRVELFMEKLKRDFSIENGELFVSVHSGRGNFSKELEGPLANYPFVSLSAIENAYNNSKFLLSQLFYNTIFIGKGKINKKDK